VGGLEAELRGRGFGEVVWGCGEVRWEFLGFSKGEVSGGGSERNRRG
jgi:hypothetical protein